MQWLDDQYSALQDPPIIQSGNLISVTPDSEPFNTFYFDSGSIPEFLAFRVSDLQPLIAGRYIIGSAG